MRYKYCPKCDILRPKTLMMSDRCEACRDDALTIEVPRSAYGRAMYVTSAIAAVLIVLYLAYHDYNAPFASFMSGIDETTYIAIVFGTILLAFVFSFLDMSRTGKEARRIIEERKRRISD